jgi:ABC-type antimicrobial peptide transport system permease subunit
MQKLFNKHFRAFREQHPPRWADRFLQWYCKPELLEEIQGDAYEIYLRSAPKNPARANAQFVWNVVRFLRWKNIKRSKRIKRYSNNYSAMLRSYLITGFRNMIRNIVTSLINVVGLAVAIGCAVMIYILLDSYYNLDAMHEKRDRIWLVANHAKDGDHDWISAPSPRASAGVLKENAAVEQAVRAQRSRGAVRVGDKVFPEGVWFVDAPFMDVFSFEITQGNRKALNDQSSAIITEEMAIKYFGEIDPIGKTISIKFSDTEKEEYTVGAVAEDTPANSSMYFNILLPMRAKEGTDGWEQFETVTFILTKENASIDQLSPTLEIIKKNNNLTKTPTPITKVELIQLPDVAQRTPDMYGSLSWGNEPAAMVGFAVLAVFLVLLACFNYMNVAVASVSTRLKEIGIRKVIGGGKKELIQQFLIENVMVCAVAMLAGTALAYFFLVPGFDQLYPVKIEFEISSFANGSMFFGSLLLLIALISGAYPAIYVASFNPVSILKGKEKFGNKSLLSRILLGAQFTLSVTTIISCLVLVWAGYYFERMDWGYNHEQTIAVPVVTRQQFEQLRDKSALEKEVISVAGAQMHIGKDNEGATIKAGTQDHNVDHFAVGPNYIETANLRLLSGRTFDENIESDKAEAIVINQDFAELMAWKEPVGQYVMYNDKRVYVIGVVEDFRYNDFFNKIKPVMFTMAPQDNFKYIVVKTAAGRANVVFDFLQSEWHNVAPDDPWRGFLQDDVFRNFFESNKANNIVGYFISGTTLLLACMGLYGLVAYNLTRRLKEFSIRKVFGAKLTQIFRLMNGDYVWIVLIAFTIGAPLGSYLIGLLIESAFPEPIPVDYTPYIITVLMMVTTVALTISTQLRRISRESPTVTLRAE